MLLPGGAAVAADPLEFYHQLLALDQLLETQQKVRVRLVLAPGRTAERESGGKAVGAHTRPATVGQGVDCGQDGLELGSLAGLIAQHERILSQHGGFIGFENDISR